MSFELLETLEARVKAAVENIELLRMEIDELKEQNTRLQEEKTQLQQEQEIWHERLKALLGRIDDVDSQ